MTRQRERSLIANKYMKIIKNKKFTVDKTNHWTSELCFFFTFHQNEEVWATGRHYIPRREPTQLRLAAVKASLCFFFEELKKKR